MKSNLIFLLNYYRPYAGRMIATVLIGLPVSAISLAFPALTGDLVDNIVASKSTDTLQDVGMLFLGLLVIQAIIGYFVSITLAKTTERVIAQLRTDLFTSVVKLPMQKLAQHRVGELSSRIASDLTQIQETFSFSILQLLRQTVFLVGSLAIIISTSLPLTIPIAIGMPVIVAIAIVIGRKIRVLSTATQDALATTATIVEESLQSVTAVKTYQREEHEISRYKTALAENVNLAIKGARLRALFVTFIITTIFGGIAAVILYGANLVAEGAVTMGELLSFLMYAMFVGGALGSYAGVIGQIQKSLGASVRIQELMNADQEPINTTGTTTNATSAPPYQPLRSIRFENVSFFYPEREDAPVLHELSFDVLPGQRVAFVGESGAGKSTTAALIQRLYSPTAGKIFYDDINSEHINLNEIRANIGVVPQDIVLFGGSIEDNIRYGKLDATSDELHRAAEQANVLEFTNRFAEGLSTIVGERGIALSGGQRQRVAIARALLKNPPILILDEATSSLDAEKEYLIQGALETLMANRTTVIIAHRLSTVRRCDKILVFERGQIVEQGTHEELVRLDGGRYARWCDLQFVS